MVGMYQRFYISDSLSIHTITPDHEEVAGEEAFMGKSRIQGVNHF
jgi:hypothetical protein